MAYRLIFLLKKMWVSFAFSKATHIFSEKYLWIKYCITNEFVKLTMLWTNWALLIDFELNPFLQQQVCPNLEMEESF